MVAKGGQIRTDMDKTRAWRMAEAIERGRSDLRKQSVVMLRDGLVYRVHHPDSLL